MKTNRINRNLNGVNRTNSIQIIIYFLFIIPLTYLQIILHSFPEELPNLPQEEDVLFVNEWQIPGAQWSKWRPRSPIPPDAEIICISDAESETGEKRFVFVLLH